MIPFLPILRRHRVVRAGTAGILLYGFAGAATSPYQAIVAIRELGMPDAVYAAVIFAAAVANVTASVGIGLLADRRARYRAALLATTAIGAAGFAAVWAFPSPAVFAAAAIGPLAVWSASNALLFAKVQSHAAAFARTDAEEVGALLRMTVSLGWVLVPGAVGLALQGRASMLPAYLAGALFAAAGFGVLATGLPPDRPEAARAARPGLAGLAALAAPGLVLRLAGVALATSVLHVNAAILPLIVAGRAGGTTADVGLIVGYVALLEVVFIFVWALVSRRLSMPVALAVSGTLYALYLIGLATAHGMVQVHAASVVGGIAAAAIITLPIPYLLGLIAGRPGLSASLLAVNHFLAAGIGAAVFAAGTAIGGYPVAAGLAGTAGLAGGVILLVLDGWRRHPVATA